MNNAIIARDSSRSAGPFHADGVFGSHSGAYALTGDFRASDPWCNRQPAGPITWQSQEHSREDSGRQPTLMQC
jgi:hypothetical protein